MGFLANFLGVWPIFWGFGQFFGVWLFFGGFWPIFQNQTPSGEGPTLGARTSARADRRLRTLPDGAERSNPNHFWVARGSGNTPHTHPKMVQTGIACNDPPVPACERKVPTPHIHWGDSPPVAPGGTGSNPASQTRWGSIPKSSIFLKYQKSAKNSKMATSRSIYSVRAWSSSAVKYHIGNPDTYPPYPYHNYDILEHFNFCHPRGGITTYFWATRRRRAAPPRRAAAPRRRAAGAYI